jgi:beta-barrel assembly-enhancing protease
MDGTLSARLVAVSLMTVSLITLGIGCSFKKPGDESVVKLSKDEQQILEDYKAEVEVGRNMAGRLLAFYGEYLDPGLTQYVNKVGRFVANNGDYADRRYLFAILDSDSTNAFACPGGYILLTRGVIQNAENEAELAAILGHETAHVGKQHMFKTLKAMNKADADKSEAEFASRHRLDKFSRARSRPVANDSETGSALAKFMSTASGAGLGILQAAKAGMGLLLEKGLDKEMEFEADREGVKYAIRAGYEPKALDDFLARLAATKLKSDQKTVMDVTHPSIPDRRKAIAEVLSKMSAEEIIGAVGKDRFEASRSALKAKKKG